MATYTKVVKECEALLSTARELELRAQSGGAFFDEDKFRQLKGQGKERAISIVGLLSA